MIALNKQGLLIDIFDSFYRSKVRAEWVNEHNHRTNDQLLKIRSAFKPLTIGVCWPHAVARYNSDESLHV